MLLNLDARHRADLSSRVSKSFVNPHLGRNARSVDQKASHHHASDVDGQDLTPAVHVNLATKIRIGSALEKVANKGLDRAEAPSNAAAGPSDLSPDDEQLAAIMPTLTPAQIEQQQRQQDLDRLNMMPVEDRRTIASMDMMGDFGSKVSYQLSHLRANGLMDGADQFLGEAPPVVSGEGFCHASRRILKLVRQSSK